MYVILYERTLREPWGGAGCGESGPPARSRGLVRFAARRRGSPRPARRLLRPPRLPRTTARQRVPERGESPDARRSSLARLRARRPAMDPRAALSASWRRGDVNTFTSVLILLVESVFTPFSVSRGAGAMLRTRLIRNALPVVLCNSRPPGRYYFLKCI